jgi:hypothetical protein
MDKNLILYDRSSVLTPQFCNHLVNHFDEDDRKHLGSVGEGRIDDKVKTSVDLNITDFPEYHNENLRLKKALDSAVQDYKHLLEDANERVFPFYDCAPGVKNTGFQIQRTDPGGFYTWHSDEHWYSLYEKETRTVETYMRGLTYIFYLNDITEDGYTEFIDGTKIQPKKGYYLIFPSTWTYLHRGYPPKSETKYIATGWIYGHKRTNVSKQQIPPEASDQRPAIFTTSSMFT